MKFRSIAIACVLWTALNLGANGAQAQSNAALFGRVVVGVDYRNNIADASGNGRGHLVQHAARGDCTWLRTDVPAPAPLPRDFLLEHMAWWYSTTHKCCGKLVG